MNRKQRRQAAKEGNARQAAGGAGQFSPQQTFQMAVRHYESGRLAEAEGALAQIQRAQPDVPDVLHLLALIALRTERPGIAVGHLEKAVAATPDSADLHDLLSSALVADGRVEAAATALERAISLKPDFADAHYNLGNVLKRMGRLEESLGHYAKASALAPDFADAHYNLGLALKESGRIGDAVTAYRRALAIDPEDAEAHTSLGSALQASGEPDEAMAAYRRALEIDPGYAEAHNNLGLVLYASGKPGEAVAAYRRALEIKPELVKAHHNLGEALLEQGNGRAALDACEACLKLDPGNTAALATRAIALAETGDRDGARFLIDFDRLLQITRLDAPDGFDAVADFNRALERHIHAQPTLAFDPVRYPTRSGRNTNDLLLGAKGPIAAFEELIHGAIQAYRRFLPADPAHPFVASAPERWRLSVWGVVLERQGHQIPHIHKDSWLSGVYYVKLPAIVAAPGQAGWIEFGRPPASIPCSAEPRVKTLRPEEGLMVLFPSYFHHRTIPFESDEQRISIAFDVMPVAAPGAQ
ncbi:MAG: tetratricopeptide repeat protein [Rhodospirillales bacterium]